MANVALRCTLVHCMGILWSRGVNLVWKLWGCGFGFENWGVVCPRSSTYGGT